MVQLQTFQVFPKIPENLQFLETLARNMWWCWRLDAIELFRRVDPKLWVESGRNPLLFSTLITQARLDELSRDESYIAHLEQVREHFESEVLAKPGFFGTPYEDGKTVAYFSMEFGIHESLPFFAGGLGILSGDHLKAASDLGIPLVGVGLLYQQGYFRQFLDAGGWQQEEYPETDYFSLPLHRARDKNDNPIIISITGPEGEIYALVWTIRVGRITLYLLDTNIRENPPHIREINARLYRADAKFRLAQEMLLGIGGMRALAAAGIHPAACHMNEGHCAFLALEQLATTMETLGVDIRTALEIVPRKNIFTTHTPVPAGHDEFPPDMVSPYLKPFATRLGVSVERILSWGQATDAGADAPFGMSILGIRMAQYRNGVSELHGRVARKMWQPIWPEIPESDVPISHVTNGIHIPSWISIENSLLFERYLGPDWYMEFSSPQIIRRVDEIYDDELWRAHEMSRSRLIGNARNLLVKQYAQRNVSKSQMQDAESVLDHGVLTIAFARRFATYKRANLLLRYPERLKSIITSRTRPVQFIFAGKAHPRDDEGKQLIKNIVDFAQDPEVRHRILFLENYDINVARHLVQGADIWLNTPRRPMEACGTSGMKAALNGVLNVSILDGWWCEGYNENRGWRIGSEQEYTDQEFQDEVECRALYNTLENEVIPCFYDRKNGNVPLKWVKMMKESIKMILGEFCSRKMVDTYDRMFYRKAIARAGELIADEAAQAKKLADERAKLSSRWNNIRIEGPERLIDRAYRVGDEFTVTSAVHLGELSPDDVDVSLYYGPAKKLERMQSGTAMPMTLEKEIEPGKYLYTCTLTCENAGRYGFTVRVTPAGDDWIKFTPGLIRWV